MIERDTRKAINWITNAKVGRIEEGKIFVLEHNNGSEDLVNLGVRLHLT